MRDQSSICLNVGVKYYFVHRDRWLPPFPIPTRLIPFSEIHGFDLCSNPISNFLFCSALLLLIATVFFLFLTFFSRHTKDVAEDRRSCSVLVAVGSESGDKAHLVVIHPRLEPQAGLASYLR